MEFIPLSSTSKNVSAFGQTNALAIFNITPLHYGTPGFNYSFLINGTNACTNLSFATHQNVSNKTLLVNGTWNSVTTSVKDHDPFGIWMYADYECSFNSWNVFSPDLYLRACAEDSICSDDLEI